MTLKVSRLRRDARINLRVPDDLKGWAHAYASMRNTTVTQLLIDHLTALREGAHVVARG